MLKGSVHQASWERSLNNRDIWRRRRHARGFSALRGSLHGGGSYDFNYCLMSLFLLCLFGPRSSIFSLHPSAFLFVRTNTAAAAHLNAAWASATDMFGATHEMFEQRGSKPNRIECSYPLWRRVTSLSALRKWIVTRRRSESYFDLFVTSSRCLLLFRCTIVSWFNNW